MSMPGLPTSFFSLLASLIVAAIFVSPSTIAQSRPATPSVAAIVQAVQSKQFDEALRLVQIELRKNHGDKRLWTLRGMALAGKGADAEALASFEHSLTIDSGYLPALEGAAQIDFQRNSPKTKSLLLAILAQRPEDPTSNAMLGFVDYREKDCKEAVASFQLGEPVLANQPNALGAYGYCLAAMEKYEASIPVFLQALELDSQSQHVRLDLALAQWRANHPQDALTTLEPLIGNSPPLPTAQLLAAGIYESTNDTTHAVALLRSVILKDPKNVEAYLDFASMAFDHDSLQVGVDYLSAGLTQLPREPHLYAARGILRAQLGQFQDATEDFAKANELDSQLSLPEVAQGLVASQEHHSDEALQDFRTAAKNHSDDALAQYLLAEALSERDWANGSAEYREEIAAAERAAELDPGMTAAHDMLATVYLRTDEFQKVIRECRAALAVDPNDQQAVFHLLLALRKTGSKDEVSGLVKRLAELRASAASQSERSKRFRLEEVPGNP